MGRGCPLIERKRGIGFYRFYGGGAAHFVILSVSPSLSTTYFFPFTSPPWTSCTSKTERKDEASMA